MPTDYDRYYQTEYLFGEPYPELLAFYSGIEQKGKLLDLGCGQGRDAIALAKLGFEVTGIDHSAVGIEQLNRIAKQEGLPLTGLVTDIYAYDDFDEFDFILLNSMFHFNKKDNAKETAFLNHLIREMKPHRYLTICIQDTGKKVAILQKILQNHKYLHPIHQTNLLYKYEDKASNHVSETIYEMITVQKG